MPMANPPKITLPILFLCLYALAVPANADPNAAGIPNPDPELERRSFKIDPAFEINLFASDPMIEKPIQINWDNQNRLWCATSQTYPQIKPGQAANDKIYILEDTKGTGKADKSTVFADGLFIPNAVVPGDGGAYVTNSTEILHLRDTGGTGKADQRQVVLAGFGTEDTHHIVHTLHWGPDGKLYFIQSIYIHSHLETPRGVQTLLGSGVWRFDTHTLDLSVYSRGLVNPWGLIWDKWGQTFQTDGAGGQGINYSFPGAGFESAVGMDRLMPGLNPGSPKYVSEEILTGRNVPDDYQGDILTNDFRANRIVRFKISENGAGYASRQMSDFLTSTDQAFRPVDIRMGPDGAIYISDWYNPIIQHGEVDFRDPRRDHTHGRIWRVAAKGRSLVPRPKIFGQPIPQLLDLLKAPEDFTRRQARLTLRERDPKQVLAELDRWVKKLRPKDPQADHQRLETLWVCENLDEVEPGLLERVLKSDEPRARAAACVVVGHWAGQLQDPTSLLEPMVNDPFPRVRLEAIRALAAIPSPQSVVIATRVLDKPMDPVLEYGLWLTCNDLKSIWMPAFQSGKLTDWGKADHLNYALQAVKSPAALKTLVDQLKSGKTPAEAQPGIIDLIANIGGEEESDTLLNLALSPQFAGSARVDLLRALNRMGKHQVRPGENPDRISSLLDDPDPAVAAQAIALTGTWKLESARPKLEKIAAATGDAKAPRLYELAMQSLGELGGEQSAAVLGRFSGPDQRAEVRASAIAALASIDIKDAAGRAAELLLSGKGDPGPLLIAFLNREGGADALAAALKEKKVPPDTAKLSLRALRSAGAPDSALSAVFTAAAGISGAPVRLSPGQMQQMIADVQSKGDAARGEQVFRRNDTGCYQCHSIANAGGWLAPDLASIGASSPIDYLIDSVLDPNKAIKDGYQGYTIVTNSGESYSGIKVRQDAREILLRDNAHLEIPIAISQIKAQKDIGSLMPNGLADVLTHQEFLDLIKFLSELGKPGPYGPSTSQYIRRWRVIEPLPENLQTGEPSSASAIASLEHQNWPPAYSLVSGVLPLDAVDKKGQAIGFVQGEINVIAPGKVRMVLNDPRGLSLWMDDKSVEPASEIGLDLKSGTHVLTCRVNPQQRGGKGIRIKVTDSPGSTGHAQPVGGK
jgi:putative heme-binding domain-containing protein